MATEPPRLLVLGGSMRRTDQADGTWAFLLQESSPGRTRLVVRMRAMIMPQAWLAVALRGLVEVPSAIMQRRMLLGIRRRAEARQVRPAAERPA